MSEPKVVGGRTPEQESLRKLYDAAPGTSEHRDLERQFNEHRRTRLGQSEKDYQPLRDVRHEFQFSTIKGHDSDGNSVVIHRVDGTLRDPATVINWRNTDVGKGIDQHARSQFHGTGDDAGHLAALWAGADPKEMQNLGAQNFVQNQGGGTYHGMEGWYRQQLAGNTGGLKVQIDEKYMPDKYGERPMGRIVRLEGDEPRYFVNPSTPGVRDRELGVAVLDPKAERSGYRADVKPGETDRTQWGPNVASLDDHRTRKMAASGPPPSQGAPATGQRSGPPPSQAAPAAGQRSGPPPSQGAPVRSGPPPAQPIPPPKGAKPDRTR